MKHFVLIFTALMFLANTVTVAAWAKPCASNMGAVSVQPMGDVAAGDDMPCHDQAEKNTGPDRKHNDTAKHCDGLCLCVHASIHQTPVMLDDSLWNFPLVVPEKITVSNETVLSWASYPPRRPPKL